MKNFDQIARYLDNQMSAAERADFEEMLQQEANRALKRELEVQRIERSAIKLHREDQIRSIYQEVKRELAEEPEEKKGRRISLRTRLFAFAASITVLLIAGFFIMRNQYDNQRLALASYDLLESALKSSSEAADPLREGKDLLFNGQYEEAISSFSEVEGYPTQTLYFTGHAYFQMKDYQAAATAFKSVADLGKDAGNFRTEAKWYYVLSKLALSQEDEDFQSVLQDLIENDGSARVKKLNRQLNSIFR